MHYIIYETINTVNKKIYIGKHKTPNLDDNYLGSGKLLNRAIEKYGIEKFQRKVLHVFETEEEMNVKEAEIVTEDFCLRKDTYNLCVGGKGGWSYVNRNGLNYLHYNENSIKNLKKNWTGDNSFHKKLREDRVFAKEYKQKLSKLQKDQYKNGKVNGFRGRKHNEKTKRKIGSINSVKQKGKKNSQYGTCWVYSETEQKSKKINRENLAKFLSQGWKKGRKLKFGPRS